MGYGLLAIGPICPMLRISPIPAFVLSVAFC